MSNDAVLLRRYTEENSEPAFQELVQRYLPLVYSSALRRCNGNTHTAADVAQRVFIALAQQARSLTRHAVLTAWLFATTRNIAVDLVRAEQRRHAHEQLAHTMHEIVSPADASADWNQLWPLLERVMDELSAADREAVLLRYFEQRSFAEIGAALNVSEDAARMRTDRALDKLRALLASRGITSTTAALGLVLANQAVGTVPAGLAAAIGTTAIAEATAVAAATATLATVLGFMSTTKFAATAATIIAILALGTAGYQIRAQQSAEGLLGTAKRNHESLVARLRDLHGRADAAEGRLADLKSRVAAAEAGPAVEELPKATAVWDPKAEGKAFLQRHPEVQQAYIEWLDSMAESTYGEFWKSRGLSPAQIEQFKILQRSGWYFTRNITADKKQGRLTIADPMPKETSEAAYRALLGEEGFRRYREQFPPPAQQPSDFVASTTRAAREQVKRVASGLCFSETPLTTQQAEQLTQIIAESFRTNPLKRDWDVIDAKARAVLVDAQFPAWETYSTMGRTHRDATIARMSMAKPASKK